MAKEGGMDYTDLVRIADKAMYEAKMPERIHML